MAVTAAMVKELRDMTGAGMMDCKKALIEAEENMDKAVEILKEKGLAKAAKKAGRIAAMGLVRASVDEAATKAGIVEVNSETDFVAKNPEFIEFVETLAAMAKDTDAADMDAFMALPYGEGTVKDELTAKISKIGENMNVRRFEKAEGDAVISYIHGGGTIGVIVAANGDSSDAAKEALKNLAMQVAAMNPQYIKREDISADELVSIRNITLESALHDPFSLPKPILNGLLDKAADGVWGEEDTALLAEKRADKSFNFNYLPNFLSEEAKAQLTELALADKEAIVADKIFGGLVEGRVSKQLKDICLMDQVYVKAEDGKQTVAKYLDSVSKDMTLAKVIRFEVGEGIEKKEENFAEEVAKQMA